MQDTLTCSFSHPKFHFPSAHHDFPSLSCPRHLHLPTFSLKTITPLPPIPPRTTQIPSISPPPPPQPPPFEFQDKLLYLDSMGIDFLSLINHHPPIMSTSLADIKSTVNLIASMNFTTLDFRRIVSMCPEILTRRETDVLPVFTFLLREAKVNGSDLRRVITRRPRLLVCCVKTRLRPTLYFLQSIGIAKVNKHTYLLSCSVEDKLIPRLEYFKKIGFSHKEATAMFRRFPQLFNYSINDTYEPKLNYFVVEMGRDLKELKKFPRYFSFSLENRIMPRHQCCVEKGVCFPLHVLLKTTDGQFRRRLDACCNSSLPLMTAPSLDCHTHTL